MQVQFSVRFLLFLAFHTLGWSCLNACSSFSIREATIQDLQTCFRQNRLTSRQLVEFYLDEIENLNRRLNSIIEVNPDALYLADKADRERKAKSPVSFSSSLHGIPILLKDNIATKDKLNTTGGSLALLGSIVPRDAGVVMKLRKAGAIILGKATMSEWAHFRSFTAPNGWSARGGQGKNPYVLSATPCGSSSGSAISVASNMVTVSLGTETDGSILCPSSVNSVVGIKPTVGLVSRAGAIPISPRQDTIGYGLLFIVLCLVIVHTFLRCHATSRTICLSNHYRPITRTVSDAVHVLDVIVGFDRNDAEATRTASRYIPPGGYARFLRFGGLNGKRLGIVRNPFFNFSDTTVEQAFDQHFRTLRQYGATLVDNLQIANIDTILNAKISGEAIALLAEFKIALNAYLQELTASPVGSLADIIAFNDKFSDVEMIKEFGQNIFLASEATHGIGDMEKLAIQNLANLTRNGFEKLMIENDLDALVTAGSDVGSVLAIGGFPGITVPAAYDSKGVPIGVCFSGLKGSEPTLIQVAYGFEQATKIRKIPTFLP